MTRIRTLAPADMGPLLAAWRALWMRCAADPFQHPAWLLAWWDVFAPGEPFILVAGDERRLDAVAPLWREPVTHRLLPFGVGPGDRTDILIDPGAEDEIGIGLAQGIADVAGSGEVLWPDCPPDGAVGRLAAPAGRHRRDTAGQACPVLELGAGAAAVPAARWRKWRMAAHRASRRGDVRRLSAREIGLPAFVESLVRHNRARFAGPGGVFEDDRMARFAARALPALDEHGVLDGEVLQIDGREAGIHAGFRTRADAYAWLGGFDPEFAFESPGTLLMGHAIRRAIEAGLTRFDFLRGSETYKYGWGATDVPNRCIAWVAA